MKQALKVGLGLGLGGLLLWLALRMVDLGAVAAAMAQVPVSGYAWAMLALALGYGARVMRWRGMLAPQAQGKLTFGRPFVAFLASTAVNNLVPLRAGDALRCFGFSRWLGVSSGAILGTMLVERLADLIALLLGLALAVWWLAPPAWQGLGWGALVLALLGVMILAALMRPHFGLGALDWGLRQVGRVSVGLAEKLGQGAQTLRAALTQMGRPRAVLALAGWTLPVWVLEGACYWAIACTLSGLSAPEAAWLALPAGTLATLLPTTPGHLGPFDYAAQAATLALGNPIVEATAFVLIVHAVLWATTTATGLVCLLIWTLAAQGQK
jgi:glycosyltransferase 2 family protein